MNLLSLLPAALPWLPAPFNPSAAAPPLPPGLLTAAPLLLWAVLLHTVSRQAPRAHWWAALPPALALGGVAMLAALQLLPPGPPPGLAQWGYRLAPGPLWQAALGFGLAAGLGTWPLLALRAARRAR